MKIRSEQGIRHSCFLLVAFVLITGMAAADFFVSPQGSDANPGTQDKPFAPLAALHGAAPLANPMSQVDSLWMQFSNPPMKARMRRIEHEWRANHPEMVKEKIARMKALGFGGCVSSLPCMPGYATSDVNFQSLEMAALELQRLGMVSWFYDEYGYPSGRAGSLVLKQNPELTTKGLFFAVSSQAGGHHEVSLPPGQLLSAVAYGQPGESFNRFTQIDGKLEMDLPNGKWTLVAITTGSVFENTQTWKAACPHDLPYVDMLNPETSRRFIEITHKRVVEKIVKSHPGLFCATFTDEPSTGAMFFNLMPYGVLPWSAIFREQFQARRGYDLVPKLSALAGDYIPDAPRVRVDYYQTIKELFIENFFKPLVGQQLGKSGGHALLEENVLHHPQLYGDLFACLRALEIPGIDVLSSKPDIPRTGTVMGMDAHVPYDAARFASSAAQLNGHAEVMCEVSDHIQNAHGTIVTEAQFRGTYNRLLWGGITEWFTYSGFKNQPDDVVKRLTENVARANAVLANGCRLSDVAVLYPIESAWVHMKPSRHWAGDLGPEALAIGQAQKEVTQSLFEAGRDYDYIDSQSLAAARIDKQELVCGRLRYRVVVLPAVDTLSADAWVVLNRYCAAGGRVVFVATQPRNSLKEFPCDAIQVGMARILERYRTRCVFLPLEKASTVGSVIDGWLTRVLESSTPSPLRVTQRLADSIGVLYIMNDSDREWHGTIRVNASDKPLQIWNPGDGSKRVVRDPRSLEIKLEAWSSLICVSEGLQRTKLKWVTHAHIYAPSV